MVAEEVSVKLNPAQMQIMRSRKDRNALIAGQGGGKTHLAGHVSMHHITQYPQVIGLIAANTHQQLTKSTMSRIRQIWRDDYGLMEFTKGNQAGAYVIGKRPPEHWPPSQFQFDDYNNIISFQWGACCYTGSLENYKALDGIEIGWAWLDETKDTREEAVKEVIIGRLRQQGMYKSDGSPWNPLYISTSPAKVQWLNEFLDLDDMEHEIKDKIFSETDFFSFEDARKSIVIYSAYLNKKHLPEGYIEGRKAELNSGLVDMLIYGCPFSKSGGEAYKEFNRDRQIKRCPYNPNLPLYLAFDFNVLPYVTLNVLQQQPDQKTVWQIDEICPKPPKNRTAAACREFASRYKGHQAGVIIDGDPAGRHEDTRTEVGSNDYSIIMKELELFKPKLRVAKVAPPVVGRIDFLNSVFENNYEGLAFIIDEKCKNAINDYTYLKEAMDGTKAKDKVKDPETGQSYEKYGHSSDANDYALCNLWKREFRKHSNIVTNSEPAYAVGINAGY